MSTDDKLIADLRRENAELKRPRTVTLRNAKGDTLVQAIFPGDQRFLWTSAHGDISVAIVEIA